MVEITFNLTTAHFSEESQDLFETALLSKLIKECRDALQAGEVPLPDGCPLMDLLAGEDGVLNVTIDSELALHCMSLDISVVVRHRFERHD